MKTWTARMTFGALKACLESPAADARRSKSMAKRLQALRIYQTALVERERALLPHLQLVKLARDRVAADIRMGEAWELAIAASRGHYTRLRREVDRLAKERATTERTIVALETRLPAAWRWSVLEQAPAELGGGDDLPTTASLSEPRPLEAVHEYGCGRLAIPLRGQRRRRADGNSVTSRR